MTHRRNAAWAAGAALAIGAVGMAWPDAALVGLVVLVVLAVVTEVRAAAGRADPALRWPRARPPAGDGTRREVSMLTWAFGGRPGTVSEEAVRRLRADATRRLARHGVVLPEGLNARTARTAAPADVARARSLLGALPWSVLTSPGGVMPTLAETARCVEAVERLDPAAAATDRPERTARPEPPARPEGHPS